jgi:transposase
MRTRERWRSGLTLGQGETLALNNARHRAKEAGDTEYDRRLRCILLVGHEHYTQESAAKILEVSPNCVTRWVMKYTEGGIEKLRPGKAPGRESRLSQQQKDRLAKMIEAGPEECGLDTGGWTGPIVRDLIHKRFGVKYSVEQTRKILHKLGFSVQYPKVVLAEASLFEQERWLRVSLPEIKKKQRRKAASSSSKTSASSSSRARSRDRGVG